LARSGARVRRGGHHRALEGIDGPTVVHLCFGYATPSGQAQRLFVPARARALPRHAYLDRRRPSRAWTARFFARSRRRRSSWASSTWATPTSRRRTRVPLESERRWPTQAARAPVPARTAAWKYLRRARRREARGPGRRRTYRAGGDRPGARPPRP
jgi:hypothetical protein